MKSTVCITILVAAVGFTPALGQQPSLSTLYKMTEYQSTMHAACLDGNNALKFSMKRHQLVWLFPRRNSTRILLCCWYWRRFEQMVHSSRGKEADERSEIDATNRCLEFVWRQGGGWCESYDDCYGRSLTGYGSSMNYTATFDMNDIGVYMDSNRTINPMVRPFLCSFGVRFS
jgi:hypothetical protein